MDLFVGYIVFFVDWLIKLLIEKTSFGYKKCKELYSMKVSVLAVKYLLVILYR